MQIWGVVVGVVFATAPMAEAIPFRMAEFLAPMARAPAPAAAPAPAPAPVVEAPDESFPAIKRDEGSNVAEKRDIVVPRTYNTTYDKRDIVAPRSFNTTYDKRDIVVPRSYNTTYDKRSGYYNYTAKRATVPDGAADLTRRGNCTY